MREFSFEKEEQEKILSLYEENVTRLKEETIDFFEKMEEVCNKTEYFPMSDARAEFYKFYTDEIQENVLKNFKDWVDSDASLQFHAEKLNGGEEAVDTAKNMQQDLEETIENLFPDIDMITKIVEVNVSEEDFDEFEELLKAYIDSIEDLNEEIRSEIVRCDEDNMAYGSLKPLVDKTFEEIIKSVEEKKKIFNEIKESFKNNIKELSANTTQLSNDFEKKVEDSISDHFGAIDIDGLFK